MRMGTTKRHPLVDSVTDRIVRVELRSPIVRLSPPLAAVLADGDAVADGDNGGRVTVLVTPETSRLTPALRVALAASPARWMVRREQGGYRDGFSGAFFANLEAVALGLGTEAEAPPAFPTQAPSTGAVDASGDAIAHLSIDATVVHEPSSGRDFGGVLAVLTEAVGRTRPRSWGWDEPLSTHWDPWVLTQHIRHVAPETSKVFVEGEGLSAVLTVRFLDYGIEETVAMTVAVADGALGIDSALARVCNAMEGLATSSTPTFALVLARASDADRLIRPVAYPTPNPCMLFIGAPAVDLLEIAADSFPKHGVRMMGQADRPALLLTLGDSHHDGWDALHDALERVGSDRLPLLLGASPFTGSDHNAP